YLNTEHYEPRIIPEHDKCHLRDKHTLPTRRSSDLKIKDWPHTLSRRTSLLPRSAPRCNHSCRCRTHEVKHEQCPVFISPYCIQGRWHQVGRGQRRWRLVGFNNPQVDKHPSRLVFHFRAYSQSR